MSVSFTAGGHISDNGASGVESVSQDARSDVVDPADVKLVLTGSHGLVRMAGLVLGDWVEEFDPDASASSVDLLHIGSRIKAASGWCG